METDNFLLLLSNSLKTRLMTFYLLLIAFLHSCLDLLCNLRVRGSYILPFVGIPTRIWFAVCFSLHLHEPVSFRPIACCFALKYLFSILTLNSTFCRKIFLWCPFSLAFYRCYHSAVKFFIIR